MCSAAESLQHSADVSGSGSKFEMSSGKNERALRDSVVIQNVTRLKGQRFKE